jgi:phosphate transport system ATP-binding protein
MVNAGEKEGEDFMDFEKTQEERRRAEDPRRQEPKQQNPDPQDATQPAMVIEGLSAYYGAFQALTNIDMSVQQNKVTALIGPSGCGKSTFIRCLNRMHEVTRGGRIEGKIALNGQDICGQNVDPVRVRRRVGMVFQKPNPFPTMSIYDNVVAGLKLTGRYKKAELDEIVERTLRQVALWDEVKGKLKQGGLSLSGGQQQRLCIARTLALEPEIVLMDEPASALDPVSTQKIEDAMHELKERYTVVIVTHNMQQAARISDYTGFFYIQHMGDPGRLWEFDETDKMFSSPNHKETENYVTGRFG